VLQTWTDAEKLAQYFEEFRERSANDPSAAKPRALGQEVVATRLSGPPPSGGAVPANSNVPARGGKMRWTCACCKTLVSVPLLLWSGTAWPI
jgi:hypothetical protein